MSHKIFVINTGSTSTKIALYEDEKEIFAKSFSHPDELINKFDDVQEQLHMRLEFVRTYLDEKGFDIKELSCVVARGGMLLPVKSGAYIINELMLGTCIKFSGTHRL